MLGILRGMEDVWVPLVIAAVVYLLITIPVCYMVAFKLGFGAQGVWIGYLIGLFLASVVLLLRFRMVYNKSYLKK